MRKVAWIVGLFTFASCAVYANGSVGLDKVDFQLTSKQWVSTGTALLKVQISATLNDADVVKARAKIQDNLSKIASVDWQITSFDRSQDTSGLAKLDVEAQARVALNQLNSIYSQATKVSRPGENYSIQQVDFKPSFQELQSAKNQLRANLYKQVGKEIETLNQAFPNQHYTVHQLQFIEGSVLTPQPYVKTQAVMLNENIQESPNETIANEISLTVLVDLASTRKDN